MKTKLSVLTLIGIGSVFALNVLSHEKEDQGVQIELQTSEIGKQMIDSLQLAWSGYFAEYQHGQSGPEHAIRLNVKLYEAQKSATKGNSQLLARLSYVERASQVETIARNSFKAGMATKQQVHEATAARLAAAMELEVFKELQRPE